jgi:hypothetical protein
MNNNIEQLIRNVHAHLSKRLTENKKLNKETLFEDNLAIATIDAYYEFSLGSDEKLIYSKEDFVLNLKNLFKKPEKATTSVAESPELENWLDNSKRTNQETRFECYKELLIEEGKGSIIEQLDADTYKILDSCFDPRDLNRHWDRRGLVYGHVQSGKTANYVGLINRAFDAGYQIVIVLTGITEDLRIQTQSRIDAGVVGRSNGIGIGIGNNENFKTLERIEPATSIKLDLKNNQDWRDNNLDISKKSIWVIKKNKTVLENLILWLDKQRLNQESEKITRCPFLVIDDEADNASIQSLSKKEFELWETGQDLSQMDFEELTVKQEEVLLKAKEAVLKAINRNIRVALSLMGNKTFVAYTATPYSVISGIAEDTERVVMIRDKTFIIDKNNNLFPEHFIIPIKAGEKYLGIERIFTTELNKKLPIVHDLTFMSEDLGDSIDLDFPTKRGENYSFEEIPKSLEHSIIHFIVTIIIRKLRDHNDYNTLLIHTSHLTKKADYVANKVFEYIVKLSNNILIDEGEYLEYFNEVLKEIKLNSKNPLFLQYFGERDLKFPEKINKNDILDIIINDSVIPLNVVSYHSSKDISLLHRSHDLYYNLIDEQTGEKKYRNYIVIGGNRLSRGLTLEGLTTSYFVRSSTRQDSLYQMGRWFGYRTGYEDLIRIYMPTDQILWFEGVYKLEMDLRRDFEENNNDDSKIMPRDAIIKLAYHTSEEVIKKFPSICDPNKLRHTRSQSMSFSGPTKTNRIIFNKEIQLRNFNRVLDFILTISKHPNSKLFDNSKIPQIVKNNNINYENIEYSYITKLLSEYEAHKSIQVDIDSLTNFINENKKELNRWSVVFVQKFGDPLELPNVNFELEFYNKNNVLQTQKITGLTRKWDEQDDDKSDTRTISQFLDRGSKDNSFDIIDEENKKNFEDNHAQANKEYRNLKKKPILIIYPVLYNGLLFPLFYFIIPAINGGKKVQYIVRNNRN